MSEGVFPDTATYIASLVSYTNNGLSVLCTARIMYETDSLYDYRLRGRQSTMRYMSINGPRADIKALSANMNG